MATYHELQLVRLTSPHRSADVYSGGPVHDIPAGSVGTIIDLLGDQGAYEVEFELRPPVFGPGDEIRDYGEYCIATLTGDILTPA